MARRATGKTRSVAQRLAGRTIEKATVSRSTSSGREVETLSLHFKDGSTFLFEADGCISTAQSLPSSAKRTVGKGRALGKRQAGNFIGSKLPDDAYFMISSPEGEILEVTAFGNIAYNHARRLAAERGERVAIHSGQFSGQRPERGMSVSMRGKHEWIEVPEKGYQPPKSFRVKVGR